MSARRPRFAAAAVALLVLAGLAGLAGPARAEVVQVYTKPIEPFSFLDDGKPAGFSIELWDRLSKETGLEYELHWVKTVGELIDALAANKADVAIAAISITSEREDVVDFTTPYYESGLGILTSAHGQSATSVIWEAISSRSFVTACVVLLLLLIAVGHLVWLFERRRNPGEFPPTYREGLWEATWFALATILAGSCENKSPTAVGGRIISAVWMLICIVAITYFTAMITTVMTVNRLSADINGAGDLPGTKVATARGTTAERYLIDHRAKVSAFDTIDEAFRALENGQVKAVVYDEPILLYHVAKIGTNRQKVVGRLFERQNYGIGLPQGSAHRETINRALLKLREEGLLDELNRKWFGNRD